VKSLYFWIFLNFNKNSFSENCLNYFAEEKFFLLGKKSIQSWEKASFLERKTPSTITTFFFKQFPLKLQEKIYTFSRIF